MRFVLVHLILLRLDRNSHTARKYVCSHFESSRGCLVCLVLLASSVLSLSVVFFCFLGFQPSSRLAWRAVLISLLFSFFLPAVKPSVRPRVSPSLFLSRLGVVSVCPRASRRALTWTCSDHVQLGPAVDLRVRELSPPLSIVNRGWWHAC